MSAPPAASGHRGRLVTALLVGLVTDLAARRPGTPPAVLDCGGGTGALAVPLAAAGAAVTVVDRSVDALAVLARRAAEAGVADAVTGVPGDLDADDLGLPTTPRRPAGTSGPGGAGGDGAPDGFDLVVAHDVLTAVADPDVTLASVARRVAPGGHLSVQVATQAALVLGRALAGDIAAAAHAVAHPTPGAFDLPDLLAAVRGLGLEPVDVHGVGVLSEYVSGPDLDAHGAEITDLAELEATLATRSPYRDVASRVHVLARRG